jgi:hypothetical protein
MLALPPVAPATGWRACTRLPRDHYIRLDSNVAAAKVLRRRRIGLLRPAPEPEVEQRRLADYDTALGLTDPQSVDPDTGADEGGVA